GGGVAGARSTHVNSEAQAVSVGLPPGSGRRGTWGEGDAENAVPEPASASGIVSRKLDQWRRHGRSMAGAPPFLSSWRRAAASAVQGRISAPPGLAGVLERIMIGSWLRH